MSIPDFATYVTPLVDITLRTGAVDRVNRHEPKSKPGLGLSAAVWLNSLGPAPGARHALNRTTGLVVINERLTIPMLSPPEDEIDPALYRAVGLIIEGISEDFTLGGVCKNVDLLGESGQALSAAAGYYSQDGTPYRVMMLTIPLIVNDLWGQAS